MANEAKLTQEDLTKNELDKILKSCPSPYSLLKIRTGAKPSLQQDPIHYFSHGLKQPPHTRALQIVTKEAYAMLSQPEKKELYDHYLAEESWVFSAVKAATDKEVKMEAATWPETWKRAYKGSKSDCKTYFYETQKELQEVIKLYENAIKLCKDLHRYTEKLNPFFTKQYYRSLEKLLKTTQLIKTNNTAVNPPPPTLEDSIERRMPREACDSWESFTAILSERVNHLKHLQTERLYKKSALDKICDVAISHNLEQSKTLATSQNELDASLQKIDQCLCEYISLLQKAQRNTTNTDKLGAISKLLNNLIVISKIIKDPTKYTMDKLKKIGEIKSLFAQSQEEAGLETLEKGVVGYLKTVFKNTTSIKDILTQYCNDSNFQNELAKLNLKVNNESKPQ